MNKKVLLPIISIISLVIVLILSYFIYLFISYYKIDEVVEYSDLITNNQALVLEKNTTYEIVSFNNEPDKTVSAYNMPIYTKAFDFALLQEIDTYNRRTNYENIHNVVSSKYNSMATINVSNLHTPYKLFKKKAYSGLTTLSKYQIEKVTRVSLPTDYSLFNRYFKKDYCVSLSYIKTNIDDKYLVLINADVTSHTMQLSMLASIIEKEYENNNYVICMGSSDEAISSISSLFTNKENFNISSESNDFLITSSNIDVVASTFEKVESYNKHLLITTSIKLK